MNNENARKVIIIISAMIIFIVAIVCLSTLTGCSASEADMVNYNMSQQADYFNVERRITVYNARTDLVIFEAEGYMSLSNNLSGELVATFKIGENTYKKNYIYLNDYTLYVVEDITGTHSDPYHYKWVVNPPSLIPDITTPDGLK